MENKDKKASVVSDETKRVIEEFEQTMDESKDTLHEPSNEELKEAVDKTNPADESMESRG